MNRKIIFVVSIILLMTIIISACGSSSSKNNETNNHSENQVTDEKDNSDNNSADKNENKNDPEDLLLTKLLPYKAGYTWKYNGAVEYGHRMHLKSIEEEKEKAIYTVDGEVEDVSGGESPKDFSLNLTYTVTSDSLIQKVESETMMDNNFSEIELIQTPLAEGTKWTQRQENTEGKDVTLESTIESVRKDGEQKIYTVIYEDTNSNYYQKREIKEGVGVLSFEHLYIFENDKEESMPMGYEIYYDATGFDKNDGR